MALPILSTLLGAVPSLASGVLNLFGQKSTNDTNVSLTRETNQANQAINERNLQFQEDMWNKTNEYNTPAAQVQRLRDAKLSPLSGAEGFSSSSVSAPQQLGMQAPHVDNPMLGSSPYFADAALKMAQIENIKADTNNKEADTTNKVELAASQKMENEVKSHCLKATKIEQLHGIYARTTENMNREVLARIQSEMLNNEDNNDLIRESYLNQYKTINQTYINMRKDWETKDTQVKLMLAQIANFAAQIQLGYAGLQTSKEIASMNNATNRWIAEFTGNINKLIAGMNNDTQKWISERDPMSLLMGIIKDSGLSSEASSGVTDLIKRVKRGIKLFNSGHYLPDQPNGVSTTW